MATKRPSLGRGLEALLGNNSSPSSAGVASAEVNLVWDPAWDPGKMTDEAKLEMGML